MTYNDWIKTIFKDKEIDTHIIKNRVYTCSDNSCYVLLNDTDNRINQIRCFELLEGSCLNEHCTTDKVIIFEIDPNIFLDGSVPGITWDANDHYIGYSYGASVNTMKDNIEYLDYDLFAESDKMAKEETK